MTPPNSNPLGEIAAEVLLLTRPKLHSKAHSVFGSEFAQLWIAGDEVCYFGPRYPMCLGIGST